MNLNTQGCRILNYINYLAWKRLELLLKESLVQCLEPSVTWASGTIGCVTSQLLLVAQVNWSSTKNVASLLYCYLLSLFISSQVVLFRLALNLRILFLSFINLVVGKKIPKEDIGAVAKVSLQFIYNHIFTIYHISHNMPKFIILQCTYHIWYL